MSNLIQNPSFEEGLNFWSADNVTVNDNNPFEGTATARLGPGIASITQDILLGIPRASSVELCSRSSFNHRSGQPDGDCQVAG